MSVQDPTSVYHADNLQQTEDIPPGPIVAVAVTTAVVTIIGIIIAWYLLVFFSAGQRPNMSLENYPERRIGAPGEIKDLAIEQTFFYDGTRKGHHPLPLPGEVDRAAQVEALEGYGKSSLTPSDVRIPIHEAMKLLVQQQAKGSK